MWSGEKKASCWDWYNNSVRKQVPYLGNSMKKKNMRMVFHVEGLKVCQVCEGRPIWAEVCCELRHWWSIIEVVVDEEQKFKEQSLVGKFSGWKLDLGVGKTSISDGVVGSRSRDSWYVPPKYLLMALPLYLLCSSSLWCLWFALQIPYVVSVIRIFLEFDLSLKLVHYVILFSAEDCTLVWKNIVSLLLPPPKKKYLKKILAPVE